MASQTAGVAVAAGAFVANPLLGAAVLAGAALFDSVVLMPHLLGKGRDRSRAPRLLDSPVGSNEAGAPRIWAIGLRVRVPTHILFQSQKVRETTGSTKQGTTNVTQRRVTMD